MTPILYLLAAIAIAIAVVWPLSYFGYNFYAKLVEAENAKHAKQGAKH